MRRVPADLAAMVMKHVEDCRCHYQYASKLVTDVKLIDARCISAYLVPDEVVE